MKYNGWNLQQLTAHTSPSVFWHLCRIIHSTIHSAIVVTKNVWGKYLGSFHKLQRSILNLKYYG